MRIDRFALASLLVLGGVPMMFGNPPTETPIAPRGYVLVEEEVWLQWAEEPAQHLERAREYYQEKEYQRSAKELRKVAGYLKVTARHAGPRHAAPITKTGRDLEFLAHRVETIQVKSVEELDIGSARALHALAEYHYAMASEAWKRKEHTRSGEFMAAAATNLDHAAARVSQTVQKASAEVVHESREIGHRLVQGANWVSDEVSDGMSALGHQIEKVGHAMETRW